MNWPNLFEGHFQMYSLEGISCLTPYGTLARKKFWITMKRHTFVLRCSWSIACRRCSNYIFILDLIPGFNRLSNNSCMTRQETFKLMDLTRLRDLTVCSKLLGKLQKSPAPHWYHGLLIESGFYAIFLLVNLITTTEHRIFRIRVHLLRRWVTLDRNSQGYVLSRENNLGHNICK